MLSGPSFRSTFPFSINSLILCGFPLISFHLTEAPLSAFSWLYTLVCAAVNANKLWNNNRPVHVNEIKTKTKPSTSHSNIPCVLLFDLVHKQYSGIIEGWHHCRTSDSKERFIVNDILFGSAWCLVMAEIQFSLIKQITVGRPEHSPFANAPPHYVRLSTTSHYPLQWSCNLKPPCNR